MGKSISRYWLDYYDHNGCTLCRSGVIDTRHLRRPDGRIGGV